MIELGARDLDYVDSVKLFEEAKKGNYEMMGCLACAIWLGKGTKKDPRLSEEIFKIAAKGGDSFSKAYLAGGLQTWFSKNSLR